MWLKSIQLKNVKSFADSGVLEFSPGINVLVGANNSGKSTILKAAFLLQPIAEVTSHRLAFLVSNLRTSASRIEITLELASPDRRQLTITEKAIGSGNELLKVRFVGEQGNLRTDIIGADDKPAQINTKICRDSEPNNFVYPYFSRRKPAAFHEQITSQAAQIVEELFENLPSKIDRLSNPDYRFHAAFREQCRKAFGFAISCAHYGSGKQAGLTLEDGTLLPVNGMGEGTVNILAFLAHLCPASGKLFLIEELENDIHPKALKSLLEFVIEKSESNQFIISTHSNIVVRYLGSAPKAKVFSVEMKLDEPTRIPSSSCSLVPDKPEERIQILESLGYEPLDFFLWKGYLILEESTAERLIRDLFIPFLVPNLQGKLRTIAAHGVQEVKAQLLDLMRLFVFIHLCPQYAGKAWVAVDGGPEGAGLVSALKAKFKTWPDEHFRCFSNEHFESYYPHEFQEKASHVLLMPHGESKQRAKGSLAEEVLAWALTDPVRAQKEFNLCAKEILDFLKEIAAKLG